MYIICYNYYRYKSTENILNKIVHIFISINHVVDLRVAQRNFFEIFIASTDFLQISDLSTKNSILMHIDY